MVALKALVVATMFLLSIVQLLASPLPGGKFLILFIILTVLTYTNYNVSARVYIF